MQTLKNCKQQKSKRFKMNKQIFELKIEGAPTKEYAKYLEDIQPLTNKRITPPSNETIEAIQEGWYRPDLKDNSETNTNPCQQCESDKCDTCPQKARYANTNYFEYGFTPKGNKRNLKYETLILKDRIIETCQLTNYCEKRINGVCTAESCRMKKYIIKKLR